MKKLAAVVASVLLVSGGVMWWFVGRGEDYCGLVNQHTASVQAGHGTMQDLITGLPELRELAAAAPSDLKDEWQVVINAVDGLQQAFAETGVDPSLGSLSALPPTVTPAQRQVLSAAASKLVSTETREAVAGIQQQALDVCHLPLQV